MRLYAQTGQIGQAQNLIDYFPKADQEGYALRKRELQTRLNCYRPDDRQ